MVLIIPPKTKTLYPIIINLDQIKNNIRVPAFRALEEPYVLSCYSVSYLRRFHQFKLSYNLQLRIINSTSSPSMKLKTPKIIYTLTRPYFKQSGLYMIQSNFTLKRYFHASSLLSYTLSLSMLILRKELVEPRAYKVLYQRKLPPHSTRGLFMLKLHYVRADSRSR
jgi:hypothetical protein